MANTPRPGGPWADGVTPITAADLNRVEANTADAHARIDALPTGGGGSGEVTQQDLDDAIATRSRVTVDGAFVDTFDVDTAPVTPGDIGAQPVDQDLTDISMLNPSNDDFLQRKAGAWTNRTVAQVQADLGITGAGYTDEQARDAVGAALRGTEGASVTVDDDGDTITISSKNKLATLDDVTTTGAAVGRDYALRQVSAGQYALTEAIGPEDVSDLVTKRVVQLGVYTDPDEPGTPAEFTDAAGETPALRLVFRSYAEALGTTEMQTIHAGGQTPVIGWMPQDGTNNTSQPLYQLGDIIAGNYDTYMTTFLTAVKNLGFLVYVRWAHEMNGNWYPWSEQVNGNSAGQYVQAWRHVHDLAVSVGATNVRWVWTVSDNYPGSTPIAGLYPGDAYVDVVSMNGYNWGAAHSTGWRSPAQVYDHTLADIAKITTNKPLWIAEMGCAPDDGGSKAAWYAAFFDWLLDARVSAFIYFETFKDEVEGEKDWRVISTPETTAAFAAGMSKLREATRPAGPDIRPRLVGPTELSAVTTRLARTPGSTSSLWGAGNCESLSRIGLSEIPGVSGRLWLTYVVAPVTTEPINTLAVVCSGTAAAGATVGRIAIFSVDDTTKNLTKIAQTANDTTIAAEAYTDHQRPLASSGGYPDSVILEAGKKYAFGWLNIATTPAAVRGAIADIGFVDPFICKVANGQTDIADSYADSALTGWYQPIFVAGIAY